MVWRYVDAFLLSFSESSWLSLAVFQRFEGKGVSVRGVGA